MKPKKVMCPICGKEMIAESWGMKRQIYRVFGDSLRVPGEVINYVHYICSFCGNHVDYEGTESCWKED